MDLSPGIEIVPLNDDRGEILLGINLLVKGILLIYGTSFCQSKCEYMEIHLISLCEWYNHAW